MVGFCGTSGRSAWRVELAIVATLVFAGGLSGEGFASVCAERTLTLSPPVGSLVVAGAFALAALWVVWGCGGSCWGMSGGSWVGGFCRQVPLIPSGPGPGAGAP